MDRNATCLSGSRVNVIEGWVSSMRYYYMAGFECCKILQFKIFTKKILFGLNFDKFGKAPQLSCKVDLNKSLVGNSCKFIISKF